MENTVKPLKRKLILNRDYFKYCFFIGWMMFLSLACYGQENESFNKRWEELNQGFKYQRSNQYKGPQKQTIYPGQLSEDNFNDQVQSLQPSEESVIYSREKRYKNGTNNGIKRNIKKENKKGLKDIDKPKMEAPKIDYPNWKDLNWDEKDGKFFKIILIIIFIVLLAYLLYYFLFKNKTKSDKALNNIDYSNTIDINPKAIHEQELKTELENAIDEKDFRLAVRIYYILLLKVLIENDCIKWAKRKTNSHYLIEMNGHDSYEKFNQAVRIYEWTWYGKNEPNIDTYQQFSLFFKNYLSQLKEV